MNPTEARSEDGYRLWLRYDPIGEASLRAAYGRILHRVVFPAGSRVLEAARDELSQGLSGLLGAPVSFVSGVEGRGTLVAGTPKSCPAIAALGLGDELKKVGEEGYLITRAAAGGKRCIAITANHDIGVMYGVFHLLRHLQTRQPAGELPTVGVPRVRCRILNHWDNLDGSVERGYAGTSIWDWTTLPDYLSPRYRDYARANASIGINGTVLTNINADPLALTEEYIGKTAALSSVFRTYGMRVYLPIRFSAPIEMGRLATADPLAPEVRAWWRNKADALYSRIPDFGGFLVKANSEGQPGPRDYGRSHAEGANLLADALAPHGGRVMWRAFVYRSDPNEDRAKQAYSEFMPLDGVFHSNVFVQVKNGPIDFQPREPFHPLFGGMARTPLMAEFQLTQEYLGFATHLVYLGPLIKETLDADTFRLGPGSTVARVVDGTLHGLGESGIAGVANIGSDRNWCGHPFAQANWYAFGRLAWDHTLSAEAVADEWIRMTFGNDERFVEPVKAMMLGSRESAVGYMTPLGLHHLMGWDHHYGPAPWIDKGRPDWTSVYFHRADAEGIGFDRGPGGSNAVAHYNPPLREELSLIETCPEPLLLWFHHVRWDHVMKSRHSLWEELCRKYQSGVDAVREMRRVWHCLHDFVDAERFAHVKALLGIQEKEAVWWRDACLAYFQRFSARPFPPGVEPPARSLGSYMAVRHHYVPGTPAPPGFVSYGLPYSSGV